MRFVYATRSVFKLEFAIANQREAIPPNADVYAVRDGALTMRHQDGQSFGTMTPEDQHTLQELITQSQKAEVVSMQANRNDGGRLRNRLLRRLQNGDG
ncbi:MAG TPA: hypothetical protein VMS31_12610 [Pyrinomonadaceae bacterium]|nr:hypothetical protein [Pyrinomonadaceae bacterium]